MKFKKVFTLLESIAEEKAIAKIVDTLIIPFILKQEIFRGDVRMFVFPYNDKTIYDKISKITPDKILSQELPTYIICFDVNSDGSSQGNYDSRNRRINIFNFPDKRWTKANTEQRKKILKDGNVRETLIHEYTHLYDNHRSKGKYINADYVGADEDTNAYLTQNLEINARFVALLNKMERTKLTKSFEDFFKLVKQDIRGYELMNKDQQKSIRNRSLKWYEDTHYSIEKLFNLHQVNVMSHISKNGTLENYKYVEQYKYQVNAKSMQKYIKKTIDDMLSGKTKIPKTFDTYTDNRYSGVLNILQQMFNNDAMLKLQKENPVTADSIQTIIDKKLKVAEYVKKMFGLSDADIKKIYKIKSNMTPIEMKQKW